MQDVELSAVIELICKEDPRFDRKAYAFLRQALDHTVKDLRKRQPERSAKSQHVSGQELLLGIRDFALEQYGPLAKTVLNSWGITRCSDFGDMVFNLIDYNVFSKTESDRREDFGEIYDFDDVFVKPFAPRRPRRLRTAQPLSGS